MNDFSKHQLNAGVRVVDIYFWYKKRVRTTNLPNGPEVIAGVRMEFQQVYTSHGEQHCLKALYWAQLELKKLGLTLRQCGKKPTNTRTASYVLVKLNYTHLKEAL